MCVHYNYSNYNGDSGGGRNSGVAIGDGAKRTQPSLHTLSIHLANDVDGKTSIVHKGDMQRVLTAVNASPVTQIPIATACGHTANCRFWRL